MSHLSTQELLSRLTAQFPKDATSWEQATDEIRDMARGAREALGLEPQVNFRALRTPSEWNTKGIDSIASLYDQMPDELKDGFCSMFADILEPSDPIEAEPRYMNANRIVESLLSGKKLTEATATLRAGTSSAFPFSLFAPDGDHYDDFEDKDEAMSAARDEGWQVNDQSNSGEGHDTEETFVEKLQELLQDAGFSSQTFEEAGVMTRNKGLVVRTPSKQKFQVEIIEDRRGY